MDAVSQLIIASLFALHQYLPSNTQATKYFDYVVDPVTLQANYNSLTILTAAHQSCRHLFAAGSKELNMSEQELVGLAFSTIDEQTDKFLEVQTSAAHTKDVITRICQPEFDPQSFSRDEAKQVEAFIRSHISVLTHKDLNSTGAYRFFGPVELFDRKGLPMGPIFPSSEHWIPYPEIAPVMINALIATEDDHFLKHDGVYLGSLTRMAYGMMASSDSQVSGGSTLTMQLLKNLYFNNWVVPTDPAFQTSSKMKTMLRKVREWYWAKIYEKHHERLGPGSGKKFVLENYLNLMDYGPGIRGIDQAAKIFFQKSASQLDLADASFMASLFKGPSRYSRPGNYATYTEGRRAYVLKQLSEVTVSENGFSPIKAKDRELAQAKPLPQWEGNVPTPTAEEDYSLYLRSYARDFITREVKAPTDVRVIEAELKTTIDMDLQKIVFNTVRSRLDEYDADREKISRVAPARDDRSEIATPLAEDISADIRAALSELKTSLDALQVNTRISVFLGDSGSDSRRPQFFDFTDTTLTAAALAEVRAKNSEAARFVGQVIITELDPARCPGIEVKNEFRPISSVMSPLLPGLPQVENPSAEEETVIDDSFSLPGFPEVAAEEDTAGTVIPLPRRRPDNADELIAAMQKKIRENLYLGLPSEPRPAVTIPFASQAASRCVHFVNQSTLKVIGLADVFEQTQDTVSKRLVRNALLRIESLAPRPNMIPAIADGRDSDKPLVIAPAALPEDTQSEYSLWVRPVQLTTKSGNHQGFVKKAIQRGNLRTGQILWIGPQPKQDGVFRLIAPKLQAAVVIMNSETGDVLANFGGYHPATSKYFDRSRLAARQPGSTLKPWLYYQALNKGFEPMDQIQNAGVTFKVRGQKPYVPDNFSGGGGSFAVGFEDAFIHSLNKAAVGLLLNPRFGPDPMTNLEEFHALLLSLGLYQPKDLPVVPSITLGSQGLSILDLVSSLTYFGNGKHIARPRFFTSFANGQGRSLYRSEQNFLPVPYSDQAEALFQMQSMLIEVANSGTASRLRKFTLSSMDFSQCDGRNYGMTGQVCFGGKTGTSSDSKDNWFTGVARNFVIGVWVGYDFPESTDATGGRLAVPIFEDIIREGYKHLPPIEPIVTSAPAGLNLVYMGSAGNCQTTDGSGTPIYTRQDPMFIPACITCKCQEVGSNGWETLYTLMVNGVATYDTSWGTYDYFTLESCEQEKAYRCGQ